MLNIEYAAFNNSPIDMSILYKTVNESMGKWNIDRSSSCQSKWSKSSGNSLS